MPHPSLTLISARDAGVAAEAALSPAERETLAGFRFAKRRDDWLLGRYAAKLAVVAATGGALAANDVVISSAENGQPLFNSPHAPLDGWHLSLTHSHGHAAALVAPMPVGIDLELMRGLAPNGWRFYLTEAERDWLAPAPLGPEGEIVAWALKEAAYKAVSGETVGMHHLTLDRVEAGTALIGHGDAPLAARWVLGGGFCLAIATACPAPSWFDSLPLEAPTGP